MKLNPKVIRRLKESLPPGFGPVLREKLLNAGHDFSVGYIYRVINPDEDDFNMLILDEALLYLGELKKERLEKEEKILELTQ